MKNEFGIYLKCLREKYNLSVRGLAEKSDISFSHLSNIENGRRTPPEHDKIITIIVCKMKLTNKHIKKKSPNDIELFLKIFPLFEINSFSIRNHYNCSTCISSIC